MTDELELLKKDWQKKEEHLPKLSYGEIHTMIWKKSSSIVKWILIISVLELTLPNLLYLIPGMDDSLEVYNKLNILNVSRVLWGLGYLITFYFVYQFYRRYKEISILDNAKDLMEKIIRTRRTVKHYVICTLSVMFIACMVLVLGMAFSDNLMEIFGKNQNLENVTPEGFKTAVVLSMSLFCVILIAGMGGIYFLLYGLLLRKLNKNYKELKRLEI